MAMKMTSVLNMSSKSRPKLIYQQMSLGMSDDVIVFTLVQHSGLARYRKQRGNRLYCVINFSNYEI